MHVFLYEWVTGGGLVELPGALPRSLVTEGAAMVAAIAADFRQIEGCHVSTVRDVRLDEMRMTGCSVVEVHSATHLEDVSSELAAEADHTLVIAPEFDRILTTTLARLRSAGGLLNASDEFVRLASNKHACLDRLAAAGVLTPPAVLIDADQERLPADFDYPAVLKPIDGAGSQHTWLVDGPGDEPPPHPWPRRLERYCVGRPASVAFLCGPGGALALPPCWQRLSDDGRFTYHGGALITEGPLAQRAASLATQAIHALPPADGYVGVDLILGPAADASEDVVLEINPRLTTSYIGLRAAVRQNLAEAMLHQLAGEQVDVDVATPGIHFSSDGSAWTV